MFLPAKPFVNHKSKHQPSSDVSPPPPPQSLWSVLSVEFLSQPSLLLFLRFHNSTCQRGVRASLGSPRCPRPCHWVLRPVALGLLSCPSPPPAGAATAPSEQRPHPYVIQPSACNRLQFPALSSLDPLADTESCELRVFILVFLGHSVAFPVNNCLPCFHK